jgi:hypothetical protein
MSSSGEPGDSCGSSGRLRIVGTAADRRDGCGLPGRLRIAGTAADRRDGCGSSGRLRIVGVVLHTAAGAIASGRTCSGWRGRRPRRAAARPADGVLSEDRTDEARLGSDGGPRWRALLGSNGPITDSCYTLCAARRDRAYVVEAPAPPWLPRHKHAVGAYVGVLRSAAVLPGDKHALTMLRMGPRQLGRRAGGPVAGGPVAGGPVAGVPVTCVPGARGRARQRSDRRLVSVMGPKPKKGVPATEALPQCPTPNQNARSTGGPLTCMTGSRGASCRLAG